MMVRLRDHQPIIRLNPHSSAAIVKDGRDEGGWCGLGAQFVRTHGMAVEGTGPGQWPLHSRDLRYNTTAVREAMKLHRMTEEWVDLSKSVYDQNLSHLQNASSLFHKCPGPRDYLWWGHSVCGIRKVRLEKNSWGTLILNSWKGWGRYGLGVLRGSRERCDGALSFRVATAVAS